MRILILNWRDIKNPSGGGAEILTHELAKKWIKAGHNVIQISAKFNKSKAKEKIDNIEIHRMGTWWNVYFFAFFYYIFNLRDKVDIIIDEVHGIPFFSVFYSRRKTILLVCEVAHGLFFKVFPLPLAIVGRVLERLYLITYQRVPTLAISESTKKDLIKNGFNAANITILPMGLTIPKNLKKYRKENKPTLVYLSRLNKQKGIEDAIKVFEIIHNKIPLAKLWVIGNGRNNYINYIKQLIKDKGLSQNIIFFGFVDEIEKYRLLSKAHILVFPSVHEGWGLVIAEAGIVRTPSIAYDISGVKDVTLEGKRGVIVKKGDIVQMANKIIHLFLKKNAYKKLISNLNSFNNEVGWENSGKVSMSIIKKLANKNM